MNRLISSSLVIGLALGAACASRPPPPPRTTWVRMPHVVSQFGNGLQLLVAPDPTSDLVHVAMRYKVGSSADPRGKAGLAHLIEHLTFAAQPQGESIMARLNRSALAYNAFTRADATHYLATGRADQILPMLAIEAHRLAITCDQIPEDVFARELAVVRQELRAGGGDAPAGPNALLEAVYGSDHGYGRPIGSDAELAAMTRADACTFLRGHYAADRAILVVTGNVEPRRVETMVAKLFARVPARAASPPPAAKPFKRRHLRTDVAAEVDKPTLYAGWPLPPEGHRHRGAVEMALWLLAGFVSADDADDDYEVSVELHGSAPAELGVLVIRVNGEDAALAQVEKDVLAAARRVGTLTFGFPYLVARAEAVKVAVYGLDSPWTRISAYADALQRGARDRLLLDDLARLQQIDGDEIGSAARAFLHPDRMIAVRARPARTRSSALGAIGYRGTVDDHAISSVNPADAYRPIPAPAPRPKFAGAARFVLENGLEVILYQSSLVPTFTARLVFRAGTADDASGGLNAAAAVYGLRVPALKDVDWSLHLINGGHAWRRVKRDVIEFGVESLAMQSDSSLALLAGVVAKGDYSADSLAAVGKSLRSRAMVESRKFSATILEAIWGEGSRNARVPGATVGAIDVDAARDFRERFLTARRATLIVTGRFDSEIVTKQIQYSFSDLEGGAAEPATRDRDRDADGHGPLRAAGPAVRTMPIDRTGKQGMVGLLIAVPVRRDIDRAAVQVLAQLLHGSAWRLRSRLGAAYAPSAFLLDDPGGAVLGVVADVTTDRAADALKSIRTDLAAIAAGGDELAVPFVMARRSAMEELLAPPSGAMAAADALAAAAARGRGLEEASALANQVAALTLHDLKTVAAAMLRPEAQAIVLFGPQATTRAALNAAGLTLPRAGVRRAGQRE